MNRLVRGRVVTPDRVINDGVVEIASGRITAVRPARAEDPVASGAPWVLPGFIDIHVHGGGGHTFTTGDPAQARAAVGFHAAHGTTTMLASLVTAPIAELRRAITEYAPLIAEGLLAGVHLEGPYLAPTRCGAQHPAHLRPPNLTELADLIAAGGVRMMTIAPELPGAIPAIRLLSQRGVVPAIGHTDASYEQTRAGIDAGARVATHLANAMRPIHHREPGPIVALLAAPEVVCEQIADGVHLHEGMLRLVARSAGPDRVALVTDAMAAAGMPDGEYELGGQPVRVSAGVARLSKDDAIAGSTLTMDAALRRAVRGGIDIVSAARMAATTPARVLGLGTDRGALTPGLRADLVLLDRELQVIDVIRG